MDSAQAAAAIVWVAQFGAPQGHLHLLQDHHVAMEASPRRYHDILAMQPELY